MSQFTDNQSRAIEIHNCIEFLKTLTPNVPALLADDSTIPGQTPPITVAEAIRAAADELEFPYIQLLAATSPATPPRETPPPSPSPSIQTPQTPSTAANPTHFTDLLHKPRKNSINGVEIC